MTRKGGSFRYRKPGRRRISVSGHLPDIAGPLGRLVSFIANHGFEFKIALAGIVVGLGIAFVVIILSDFDKVRALADFKPNITTKIYDKNGVLISELFSQKREVIPYETMPEELTQALVAIEDNEFFEHHGISIEGIVRAFFINILSGRIKQGGSTLTQQLAKILLTSRKRNIYRKVKEAFIALMIEMRYTKKEILALYLNQIYLGHGTYGVEAASQLYFNKHARDLNLAECALIAALPTAPNGYSPIRHPKRAMARHRIVLAKMVELGFITIPEAEKAYLNFWPDYLDYISRISPSHNTWSNRVDRAPWFTEYIRRRLVEKYGRDAVYEKGLLVYTTLDVNKQEIGQQLLEKHLEKQTRTSSRMVFKNEDIFADRFTEEVGLLSYLFDLPRIRRTGSRQNEKINDYMRTRLVEELEGLNYLAGINPVGKFIDEYKKIYTDDRLLQQVEGCLVSIDHRTGYIEAMIGGSRFSSINQLNRVVQSRRQPGSAIKPILYAAAFEKREFTPASTILDSPVVYLDHEGGEWLPENYEGEYYGLVRLRQALRLSINVVSIRIAEALGIDYVVNFYKRLLQIGNDRIKRNFSIALGTVELSPLELTRAYAVIANGGQDVIPFSIRYIKDRDGRIIENQEAEIKKRLEEKRRDGSIQIIGPETAQIMISMLRTVVKGGTGQYADPGRPAAGKTGTTNNWKDAWFVGFTPHLTTGIWVGYDRMGLSLGQGQSGGSVAAPLWGRYMMRALRGYPADGFPSYAKLSSMEVCARSGKLPDSNCNERVTEVFIPGTEPEDTCGICVNIETDIDMARKGPRENIVSDQKRSVLKKLKKDDSREILDDLGNDLLR